MRWVYCSLFTIEENEAPWRENDFFTKGNTDGEVEIFQDISWFACGFPLSEHWHSLPQRWQEQLSRPHREAGTPVLHGTHVGKCNGPGPGFSTSLW